MIEIIQHFLLQNSTILHIYKYFWDTRLHSFYSGDFCSYTHTFTHAYTHTYMHGLIIAMHTLHVKKSHSACSQVSSKIIPIDSCAVYSSFTMFLFVSFIILCNPKLHAPYLSIQILPSRSECQNYRNKPYIAEKRMLSAVRSNLNYFGGANG